MPEMTPEQIAADAQQLMARLKEHVEKSWTSLHVKISLQPPGEAVNQKIQMAIAEAYGAGAIEERQAMAGEAQVVLQSLTDLQAKLDQLEVDTRRTVAELNTAREKIVELERDVQQANDQRDLHARDAEEQRIRVDLRDIEIQGLQTELAKSQVADVEREARIEDASKRAAEAKPAKA